MVSRNQQHNQISLQLMYAAYRAEDTELANKINQIAQEGYGAAGGFIMNALRMKGATY